jgi:hypothetical protein
MAEREQVVRESLDETRVLPGEEPESRERSDVLHWIDVYEHLRVTKRQLMEVLEDLMRGQSDDVQQELERTDLQMLQLQVERFEHRLAFWRRRLVELDARD